VSPTKVFDMSAEPSFNVFASRSFDARDIYGPDVHSKRLATALMSRAYPNEKLMWAVSRKRKGGGSKQKGAKKPKTKEDDDDPSWADSDSDGETLSSDEDSDDKPTDAEVSAKEKTFAMSPYAPPALDLVKKVCEALCKSEAAWSTKSPNSKIGNFKFIPSAELERPNKDTFYGLPMYLTRRFASFTYDPVNRHGTAGGLEALCAAIKAAHDGRAVDRLFLSADGKTVGGWGDIFPNPAAGGVFNFFTGALALEKQLEYAMPLIQVRGLQPL